jgi:hypothetical protein
MGYITYPRTYLNKRKQLFPFLNEMGMIIETIGLIEATFENRNLMKGDLSGVKKIVMDAQKNGWPKISKKNLRNFKTIRAIKVEKGTKIYRVIGLDNFKGDYWMRDLPSNELEFRRDYAVRKDWNGNGGYIEVTLEKEILAYEGEASAQLVQLEKEYILNGGASQIWFPSDEHFSFDIDSVLQNIKPTNF